MNYKLVLIAQKPGERVKVSFFQNEPVFLFKERITKELEKTYPNLSLERTLLSINGIKINDYSKQMNDYNILGNLWTFSAPILKYNNLYRLKTNEINQFNGVIIKSLLNNYFGLQVKTFDDEKIENIKMMIQDVEGIPIYLQRFIFNGHQQLNHDGTLSDYNIRNGDLLNLNIRLRGGGSYCVKRTFIGKEFADVSNDESETVIKLTNNHSKGRTVENGINIEMKCRCSCNYSVISHFGYGLFDLMLNKVRCPLCYNPCIILETVGFVYCEYRIHGKKVDNSLYESEWKIARFEDLYHFYATYKSGKTRWLKLIVESREIGSADPCPICLEVMKDNNYAQTIECGHRFHKSCILKWLGKEKSCPLCRIYID